MANAQGATGPVTTEEKRSFVRRVFFGSNFASAGRRISIMISLAAFVATWWFFSSMRGWTPPLGKEADYAFYFNAMLMVVLAIQLVLLVVTSTHGSVGEMTLDTIASVLPAVLGIYYLGLHWGGYEKLPLEQLRYLKMTEVMHIINFVVDLGVTILASSRSMRLG